MGCSTTLLGIALGFFIANIPGAVLGGLIGYVVESQKKGQRRKNTGPGSQRGRAGRREEILKNLFSLLAKFCQADGQVSRAEIRVIDDFINQHLDLSAVERKKAIGYFDRAKRSRQKFSLYAENFAALVNYDKNLLSSLIALLNDIARVRGTVSPEQSRLLEQSRNIFQINERNYKTSYHDRRTGDYGANAKNMPHGSLKEAYKTLDLNPGASAREVKEKYRELAKKYHPDRAIAQDVPEEFVEMAQEKFAEIKEAYETIMEAEEAN